MADTPNEGCERSSEIDIFVVIAYDILRTENEKKGGKYEYLHTVWSGFNRAFRQLFHEIDPVAYVRQLAADGMVDYHPYRGGARLKPRPVLLRKLQANERELAARLRKFLTDFAIAQQEERDARRARQATQKEAPASTATRSRAEKDAVKLWEQGKTADALEKLGY